MPPFLKQSLKTFAEAAANIRDNKETSLIAIFTISVAITILGLFLLVYFNLNNVLRGWSEKLQLVVYLKDDIQESGLKKVEGMIRDEGKIWKWEYLSKDDALRAFREKLKDKSAILEGLDGNPLPASFNIYFKEDYRNYEEIKLLAEKFSAAQGVEDVDYGGGWILRFEAAIFFLKIFITAVGGLLALGLITIISNTVRLSVYSRHDEIEIKKLVGATRWFIQAPFLVEGIIQGMAGVFFSLGFLLIFYGYFLVRLATGSQLLMGVNVVFLPPKVVLLLVLLGALVGGTGSLLSLRKLMRFDKPMQ